MGNRPRHIDDAVSAFLRKLATQKIARADAVREAWEHAAAAETRNHAQPVNFKNGVVTVIVENSVWLYKLTLEKKQLLEKFNEKYRGRKKAQDMRFRVGVGHE